MLHKTLDHGINLDSVDPQIAQVDALIAESRETQNTDTSRSLELARSAEDLAVAIGYAAGQSTALTLQAQGNLFLGDYAAALHAATKSLQLLEALNDQQEQAKLLWLFGFIYSDMGDYVKGLEAHLKSLEMFEILDDRSGQARTFTNIGVTHSMAGNSQLAITNFRRSYDLYTILGNKHMQAVALNSCCVDYTKLGEYALAQSSGETAAQLFLEIGDEYGAGVATSSLGEVALAKAEYAVAVERLEHALTLLKKRHPDLVSPESLETRLNLGQSYLHIGNSKQALDQILSVLAHADKQNLRHFSMRSHQFLSQIYEEKSNLAAALDHLKKYIDLREKLLNEANTRHINNLHIIHETQRIVAENERQKQLREQDRQNYERLSKIKEDFLHNATHDIKNPLAVINIAMSMLRTRIGDDDSKGNQYLMMISDSVQKILQLVTGMLDLSRLEAAPILGTSKIRLNQWFEVILNNFNILAEQKHITLVMNVQPPDLSLKCDQQRLGQALENLISNAIKYTMENGTVRLNASQQDSNLQIQMIDNGIGIPADEIPFVFDRFYRVKSHIKAAEGTGLGLSIVRLIVEQHGGTVSVESQEGQGTTFTILLPLEATADNP
ncbi:MAG: ATP-binding protein [Anaerolineae bacterium]